MELISVIVPVFKVEDYLNDCVESIVNQTYSNLEIILVDDGSPDRCPEMCDDWAAKDRRIMVIHKENGGLSDARNAGMKVCSGDYICFVDSDDWIHIRFVESLMNAIRTTGSDLAACGVRLVPDEEGISDIQNLSFRTDVNTSEEALGTLIRGEKYRAVVWNKLYKREIIIDEEFEKKKLHEDEFFTYRIIDKCRILSYINESLYYYRQRPGSIMTIFSVRRLDALEAWFKRLTFLKEKYPTLYEYDRITFCSACLNYYCCAYSDRYPDREKSLITIRRYRQKVKFTFSDWMKLSAKNKIKIIVSKSRLIDLYAFLRTWRAKNV